MIGILVALALLALYGAAIIAVFRVPFRAFGVLVGGMAVHNILLMALLRLDTPGIVIRVLQSWKEGILIPLASATVRRISSFAVRQSKPIPRCEVSIASATASPSDQM